MALAVCLFLLLPKLAQAFYNPQTGHWLSRDPIEEKGGVNLRAFVRNAPASLSDKNGLDVNLPPGGNELNPWPYLQIPPYLQRPTVSLNSLIAGWMSGFWLGLKDALTSPEYLKCQAVCSLDKELNAVFNPIPGTELNLGQGLLHDYGSEVAKTGFDDLTDKALETGDSLADATKLAKKTELDILTQKNSVEKMAELLNREGSKIGPRAARVLQQKLDSALQVKNIALRAEMVGTVFKAANATKGFYDCYKEHCAKCLGNGEH